MARYKEKRPDSANVDKFGTLSGGMMHAGRGEPSGPAPLCQVGLVSSAALPACSENVIIRAVSVHRTTSTAVTEEVYRHQLKPVITKAPRL